MESIQAETGLIVWSCHSTPIEIFVRSGLIGATLFAATSLLAFAAAFGLPGPERAFVVSLLVFMLLDGTVENFFAVPSFSSLSLFMLLGVLLSG